MGEHGPAPRGRTALALVCAGALAAGGVAAVAAASGDYPGGDYPCGDYPGGTYPGGTYPGGTYPGGTYPGGTYPNGEYPCQTTTTPTETTPTQTHTGPGTTITETVTVTVPHTPGTQVAEQRLRRTPARVRLFLGRTKRVPKGGLLTVGELSCPADAVCAPTTLALGKPKRGAPRAALAGSYGRKVATVRTGERRYLRLRVKKSAVRTMLRRRGRLGARLVISSDLAAPIVRNVTLRR